MRHSRLSCCLLFHLLCACSDDKVDTVKEPSLPGGEPPSVARGEYLVNNVAGCPDCHTPRGPMGMLIQEQYLAGVDCWQRGEGGGCLPTRNLTNHETGLLNRTDAEIKRMIRDGIRPAASGDEALFPQMPYYSLHNLTESDLDSVVAYLRTVTGVEHAVPRRAAEFDRAVAALPLDVTAVPEPTSGYPEREAALRGRYLAAEVGACIICHTPRDLLSPKVLDYSVFFTGNEVFDVGLPVVSRAGNITSDSATGLGSWSVDDIVKVIKQGEDNTGHGICPPMLGLFAGMTDEDSLDVAHYIKSLAPLPGLAEDQCTFPPM
ncbi:MAG: hypothetical protein RL033_6641 [Pseudomonadota bacterium]|jgi:mono/diheme cytochrome c family protein